MINYYLYFKNMYRKAYIEKFMNIKTLTIVNRTNQLILLVKIQIKKHFFKIAYKSILTMSVVVRTGPRLRYGWA